MKMLRVFASYLFVAACILSFRCPAQPLRQMAITIDDLPLAYGGALTFEQRSAAFRQVLDVLDQFGVKATGFVIAEGINAQTRPLLDEFVKRGHQLGNHTFRHLNLTETSAQAYSRDIARADQVLKPWLTVPKYFRYPYLRQGNTAVKKDSVSAFLGQAGYTIAPVTIDNDEWVYNRDFIEASQLANKKSADRVGEAYLLHMNEKAQYFEQLAQTKVGRPVRHILLLHMNYLNAQYLADLLSSYRSSGWTFIPLSEALKDPLYQLPDAHVGEKGLSLLERIH